MADIVERLRDLAPVTNAETRAAMTDAASEIERLRAALRETLEVASRNEAGDYIGRARAALEEGL